jgi:putative transposase
MALHQEVTTIEREIACRVCGSTNVSKDGFYKDTQYYLCKFCGSKFAGKDCYPKMKYPKDLITRTLTYYYNGMSYKNITQTFSGLNQVELHKTTLWRWVIAFSKAVNSYVLTLHPDLSDVWIADETVIDLWGTHYWFWDIIDSETRFLIASHLSRTRTEIDATKLFMMAKLRSKVRPKVIITDKLGQYNSAFNRVFYSNLKEHRAIHLRSEGFSSDINTNLIERFHGTVKQRTKVMRDLKDKASARIVMDGFITHYNFFMQHSYLDGLTPAQAGGIGEGITNWSDLIGMALEILKQKPKVRTDWENVFEVE